MLHRVISGIPSMRDVRPSTLS